MEMARQKPVLIYDAECGFCKLWISRWKDLTGDRVGYAPYQQVASLFPQIPEEDFRKSVQFVDVDGSISRGAEAVFRALSYAQGKNVERPTYFFSSWLFLRLIALTYLICPCLAWNSNQGIGRKQWYFACIHFS